MSRRRRLRPLALLIVAGCEAHLAVPPGANITCADESMCPDDYTCKESVGLCVYSAGDDTTPPSVVDGTELDAWATLHADLSVVFTVDEALLANPAVQLATPVPIPFRHADTQGLTYTYRLTLAGDEPEGAFAVRVSLIDLAGNETVDLDLGATTVDFSAPSLVEVVMADPLVSLGESGRIDLLLSEPLAEPPTVTLSGVGILQAAAGPDDVTYVTTYTPDAASPQGAHTIAVRVVDRAGNERTVNSLNAWSVDTEVPFLVGTPSLSREVARAGQLVGVSFEANEPLAVGAVVELVDSAAASRTLSASEALPPFYTFVLQLDGDLADGDATVRLTGFTDSAGNPGLPVDLETLRIDSEPPQIEEAVQVLPGHASHRTNFDQVAITFALDEAVGVLAPGLEVRIDNLPLTCTETPGSPVRYECLFDVPPDPDPMPEGAHLVTVAAQDPAGNIVVLPAPSLVLDYTDPVLATPPLLRRSDDLASAAIPNGLLLSTESPDGYAGEVSAEIIIVVSEELLSTPTVFVGTTEATLVSESGLFSHHRYIPTGLEDDVPTPITAEVQDLAGNPATLDLGAIHFDYDPPADFDPDRVVYRRSPTEASYTVHGEAGAVGLNERVRVYPTSLRDFEAIAAQAPSDPSGGFAETTAPGDRQTVYLSSVDAAGNESDPQEVKRIEWRATLADKVPGDFFVNPHRAFRGDAGVTPDGAFHPSDELSAAEYAQLAPGGQSPLAIDDDLRWRERTPEMPGASGGPGIVYDNSRDRLVMLSSSNDTWEWFGDEWRNVSASNNPTAQGNRIAAYDSARGRVVLLADLAGASETWEWDGAVWRERSPLTMPPFPASAGKGLVYDTWRGQTVLVCGPTYVWNGDDWQSTGQSAPPCDDPAYAFDGLRGRLVLYQGEDSGFVDGLTYEWNGATWAQAAPKMMTARAAAGAVFDAVRERVVLFGGALETGPYTNETYLFDGSTWELLPTTNPPPAMIFPQMAFDAARAEIVVSNGDVHWRLDQADVWHEIEPAILTPTDRGAHALAVDSFRKRTVIFGGEGPASDLRDTWEWDGFAWQDRTPAVLPGSWPAARQFAGIAFDSTRNVTVLFGGRTSLTSYDTLHEWDGTTWNDRTPVPLPAEWPTARSMPAMAYHTSAVPSESMVLMFGGQVSGSPLDELWGWDGTTWSNLTPTPRPAVWPSPRWNAAMAHDPVDHVTYMYGGGAGTPDFFPPLWAWDGQAWSRLSPFPLPPDWPVVKGGTGLAYDAQRRRLVLVGGSDWSPDAYDQLWTWHGSGWTSLSPLNHPPGLIRVGFAADPTRGRMVLHGGLGPPTLDPTHETWELGGLALPAIQMEARTTHAVTIATGSLPSQSLSSISVAATAGGSCDSGDGVVIELWDRRVAYDSGGYQEIAVGAGSSAAPALIEGTLVAQPAGALDGMLTGDLVRLRVRPLDGTGSPMLSVRGLTLTLAYRRP